MIKAVLISIIISISSIGLSQELHKKDESTTQSIGFAFRANLVAKLQFDVISANAGAEELNIKNEYKLTSGFIGLSYAELFSFQKTGGDLVVTQDPENPTHPQLEGFKNAISENLLDKVKVDVTYALGDSVKKPSLYQQLSFHVPDSKRVFNFESSVLRLSPHGYITQTDLRPEKNQHQNSIFQLIAAMEPSLESKIKKAFEYSINDILERRSGSIERDCYVELSALPRELKGFSCENHFARKIECTIDINILIRSYLKPALGQKI